VASNELTAPKDQIRTSNNQRTQWKTSLPLSIPLPTLMVGEEWRRRRAEKLRKKGRKT